MAGHAPFLLRRVHSERTRFMHQASVRRRVAILSSEPVLNELMASYLSVRFSDLVVEHGATIEDLGGGSERPCAFVVVQSQRPGARKLPSVIGRLRRDYPEASILVAANTPGPRFAIEAGAQAFIPRLAPLSVLADALKALLEGRTWNAWEGGAAANRGSYRGPCRRRAGSESWSGPERRRPAAR